MRCGAGERSGLCFAILVFRDKRPKIPAAIACFTNPNHEYHLPAFQAGPLRLEIHVEVVLQVLEGYKELMLLSRWNRSSWRPDRSLRSLCIENGANLSPPLYGLPQEL